jgi:hypothetical protein
MAELDPRDAAEGASCGVDYVALPLLAAAGALIGNARWGASPNCSRRRGG